LKLERLKRINVNHKLKPRCWAKYRKPRCEDHSIQRLICSEGLV
jgi:hypothetical protein